MWVIGFFKRACIIFLSSWKNFAIRKKFHSLTLLKLPDASIFSLSTSIKCAVSTNVCSGKTWRGDNYVANYSYSWLVPTFFSSLRLETWVIFETSCSLFFMFSQIPIPSPIDSSFVLLTHPFLPSHPLVQSHSSCNFNLYSFYPPVHSVYCFQGNSPQ